MLSTHESILNAVGISSFGGKVIFEKFMKLGFSKIYYNPNVIKNFPFLHKIYLDFFFYFRVKCNKTLIIYLSGTPPVIRNKAYIISCFQNANIFFSKKNLNFFFWIFSLNSLRYFFFKIFKGNVDEWIVFSNLAKKLLIQNDIKDYKIKVVDLFDLDKTKVFKLTKKNKKYDLIYPSDNLDHKNHVNLFSALIILAKLNIYPSVLLTLNPKDKKNSSFLRLKKLYKLNITFKEYKYQDVSKAYADSKALIYLSLNETLGLPLYEAFKFKLSIIAPNLEYVTQFIKSDLLFDPLNPKQIANKIKFFLNNKKKNSFKLVHKNNIFYKNLSKML